MALRPEQYYRSPSPEEFNRFVNRRVVPSVDPAKLDMGFTVGDERRVLSTPTTGDMSLTLSYKGKEGYLASFGDEGEALSVLQFQGAARREGYRVATGLFVVSLFAEQIRAIAQHPEAPYRELFMPAVFLIKGAEDAASDLMRVRYEALAGDLGMKYSHEEMRFVRKIK